MQMTPAPKASSPTTSRSHEVSIGFDLGLPRFRTLENLLDLIEFAKGDET
ncbi:hypothetical protein TRP8649_01566 [Pelagimonas phthalicica]|uniref:Uncharacterized protein n=1 Tax=Pelagimonas phthalicica TaxID=1037362 RepID=A0A238J9P9_9RHOB|nr:MULTISPECIES: hypothetical protein [Roseobacteraceae]MBO9465334.1 hypothetical protein [Tropicibacter sp. R15_0]TDS94014.1 hypothetical protein CLV87_0507 [Pelagimonas phthalicica]SMX27461.1 hypothetical protein TRP8649_01566 [Pelagimonas phthalicica]